MCVNLPRHGLIFPPSWRLAQVVVEGGSSDDEGAESEAGRNGRDQQAMDDPECAPEAWIGASTERGETPISLSSESVISATRRWQ